MPASILVVVGIPESRAAYAGWLGTAGYRVVDLTTGAEALAAIARSSFDLALIAVDLPDMSGLDLCDRIKTSRATSAVPVLQLATAATGTHDRSAALNRGADGYLVEPVEPDEVLATVSSLLRYHDARRTAERLATRLERLHQSTLLMNAAPTITDVMQFAGTGLTSVFGVPAAVLVARDGIGQVSTATLNDLESTVARHHPDDVLAVAAAAQVESVVELDRFTSVLGDFAGSAVASPIATPRGELVGAVLLITERCPPEDELMLDHFAQALAVALENQRLYAVEHHIALTLQRAMLPHSIPRPPYLEIAVRYLAASDTVEIGGDFYEAIELDTDTTMLAVGDVVGHSLQAATVMAELRHSLRALASVGVRGAEIVTRIGDLLRTAHPGITATLCVAEVDRRGELRVTNAGHIPPAIRVGGQTRLVTEHGVLLGLRTDRPVTAVTLPFPPGSLIVMTTDGLVERRRENISIGLQRLISAVDEHRGTAEELCDLLLAEVSSGTESFDDIAIVAAQRL